MAVYDVDGRMVRPILYGQPHVAGEFTAAWDGLDRYGDPLPAGQYEWRLLRTPGFSREFLVNRRCHYALVAIRRLAGQSFRTKRAAGR